MRTLRLFSILDLLRSRRTPISAELMAETLGVSMRTIYRDMVTLQDMGAPIRGEGGIGYQIEKGYFLPPIHFDPDEFDAFILGMRMVAARGDLPLAGAAQRAIGKINAVLPDGRHNLQEQSLLAYSTQSEEKVPLPHLSALRAALRERKKLEITYLDLKGRSSTRVIRPLGLTAFDLVWVLTAWCEEREAFRNLRVDRLQSVDCTGAIFSREAGKEFSDYLKTL
nr:YafY family protein [Agaribacter marinus]